MNHSIPPEQRQKRGRLLALALFALFFSPIIVSWILLEGPADFRPSHTSNRGALIDPPRWVAAVGIQNPDGKNFSDDYFRGLWTVLYVQAQPCTDPCLEALYKMRQSWKALNQNQTRVQRAYLSAQPNDARTLGKLAQEYPQLQVGQAKLAWLRLLTTDDMLVDGIIVIVDPEGLALMYYQPSDDARGLIKDMKRLLKLSKIG